MEFRNFPSHHKGSLAKGLLVALIPPLLAIIGVLIKYPVLISGQSSLTISEIKSLFFQVISLGLIINVILFFFFINRDQEQTAKGILVSSLVILIIGVINKFLL
ncbi:hypothetical protein [Schleiferia thermophila]|jgi:hypothetical protein|uniref:Uncharacterized protein n=1 Tax=Schleiferia thermophila TaxID=884107 RepID=A0A369A7V8_9FLAO|nr:hypothetical protein [Schleiferia thermophila]RCX05201.1 hypothetical protein DES35_101484 [Schleiferia thermophila]GCD79286.1 hypothetical protein JCM30197_05330 [Schleiferia thermophila]